MNTYKDYTIEISLKSPIVTLFQSDTIFGHICWAIWFLQWEGKDKGADKLNNFLNSYAEGAAPPLLVSNGFPKGYLPKPIIPPTNQKELEEELKKELEKKPEKELEKNIGTKGRIENSFKVKAIKSMDIISKEDFRQLQEGTITPPGLLGKMLACYGTLAKEKEKFQSMMVQHNTIDRMSGRVTGGGGLYAQEESFCDFNDEESGKFEIYLKTKDSYFTIEDLRRIFGFIKEQGYGGDKSTGKGYFTFEINEGIDLPESGNPNAFMTLSSYIPTKEGPTEGYYHTLLKYGKLGGIYAKGAREVMGNPFKKPLIMFTAGSTFYDSEYRHDGKAYGSLLNDVHHNNGIRHYAYAFPVGINLDPSIGINPELPKDEQ